MKQKKATNNHKEFWVNLHDIEECLKKSSATNVRLAKWKFNYLAKDELDTFTKVAKQLCEQFERNFISELGQKQAVQFKADRRELN